MPFMVHGFGTAMLRAGRKRTAAGRIQFDAIEAVVVFAMPLIPYKVIHVLHAQGEIYQSIPLRWSKRIIAKAMLLRWSIGLAAFGGFLAPIIGLAQVNMTRPVTETDRIFLVATIAAVPVGLLGLLIWWLLERQDDRWRRLFGATPAGTSDPLDWLPETADLVAAGLRQDAGVNDLQTASDRLLQRGLRAQAAVCLRLAQREGNAMQAVERLEHLAHMAPDGTPTGTVRT